MKAVLQGLADWANGWKQPAVSGTEIVETARYRLMFQPDFPIPGPNSASWIRCRPEETEPVIDEVRAAFRERGLPLMWVLDPGTEPANFADLVVARGARPDPHGFESAVMVLPVDARIEGPQVPGLELRDALATSEAFRAAEAVNREAFAGETAAETEEHLAALERRRLANLAQPGRHRILATVDGEPAGSAGITCFPPDGAIINGGAVRPKFRGHGVYRAMVAARLDIARAAGVEGLCVWGGPMSRPILERLGFVKVGWRRFYLDETL